MNIVSLKSKLKERNVRVALAVSVLVLVIVLFRAGDSDPTVEVEAKLPQVTVSTAAALQGDASLALLGTVRAFTEGDITAERGGRVVSVPVSLGQNVAAGQIIATLENAAEQAAVLQAQGAYEAALAASAQSTVGVGEAQTALEASKNNAVTIGKSAYSAGSNVVFTSIDTFFSSPEGSVPGLRLDGRGNTQFLNTERVAYQQLLKDWQGRSATLSSNSDLKAELAYARENVERTISFLDVFITIFNSGSNGSYSDVELQTLSTNFTNQKAALRGNLSSIDGALASLAAAEDAVKRASISASGGTTSAADAQVKQALGSLRAAQAGLAKTILRTPIKGTVNTLSVRVGDFVSPQTSVAKIANNNALEVITYIGESEQGLLAVGDTVLIDDKEPGTVAQIAPALDPVTRKIEVRIATESTGITNGNTVRITKNAASSTAQTAVYVPITAVKFESKDGYLMTVVDGKVVQKPVVLGAILGGFVEVIEGHTSSEPFVVDVRGLSEGTSVSVAE